MDPEHFLHDRFLFTPTTQQRELKTRYPFVPAGLELLKDNTTAAYWADHKLTMEWQKNSSRFNTFIHPLAPYHRG